MPADIMLSSSLSKLQRLSRRAPTAGPPPVKGGPQGPGEALALDKGVQWRSTAEGRSGSPPGPVPVLHRTILWSLAVRPYHIVWQVKEILDQNKAERHIRGGIATRKKYKGT